MKLLKLSDNEQELIRAFAEVPPDHCMGFKAIAARCSVPLPLVRRVTRALKRKGITRFEQSLFDDDGVPAGAGYGLTELGLKYLDILKCE